MSELLKYLKNDELEKLQYCFQFFKKCLTDSNRWVKNQALIQFGPIVHQIHLKRQELHLTLPQGQTDDEKYKTLINDFCLTYYDQNLILSGKEEDKDLEDSLMNKLDEYSFMQN